MEYVLVALGSCLTAGIAAVAQQRKIQLNSVRATIEAAMDVHGILGADGGVTRFPGLYLMGMPFLRRRKSTLIDGAGSDARDLCEHLAAHLDALVRAGSCPRPRSRVLTGAPSAE